MSLYRPRRSCDHSYLKQALLSILLKSIRASRRLSAWAASRSACFRRGVSSFGALAAPTDYSRQQVPRPAPRPGHVTPQHAYMFGEPAYWPAPLRWRYNPAGAPAQFSANKAATIQQLIDAAAQVDSGVRGRRSSTTAKRRLPRAPWSTALPDRVSVVGWQAPQGGVMAATSVWTDSAASGETFWSMPISRSARRP